MSQVLCSEVAQLSSMLLCCHLQGLALLFSSFSSLSSHMLSPGSLSCLSSNAVSWRYWAQAFAAISARAFFSSFWIVCRSLYSFSFPVKCPSLPPTAAGYWRPAFLSPRAVVFEALKFVSHISRLILVLFSLLSCAYAIAPTDCRFPFGTS